MSLDSGHAGLARPRNGWRSQVSSERWAWGFVSPTKNGVAGLAHLVTTLSHSLTRFVKPDIAAAKTRTEPDPNGLIPGRIVHVVSASSRWPLEMRAN